MWDEGADALRCGQQAGKSASESDSSSKADRPAGTRITVQHRIHPHTHPATNTVSAVIAPLPSTQRVRPPSPALPCLSAEYIASYTTTTTPDRPSTRLQLIHTRPLSTCDLVSATLSPLQCSLPFCDCIPRHIPAERELYSWIALPYISSSPRLTPTRPPYTASRLDSAASHTRTRLQEPARIETHIIVWLQQEHRALHHIQNTPSGTGLRRRQLLTSRPRTVGQYQPDWWPTTPAAPNAG